MSQPWSHPITNSQSPRPTGESTGNRWSDSHLIARSLVSRVDRREGPLPEAVRPELEASLVPGGPVAVELNRTRSLVNTHLLEEITAAQLAETPADLAFEALNTRPLGLDPLEGSRRAETLQRPRQSRHRVLRRAAVAEYSGPSIDVIRSSIADGAIGFPQLSHRGTGSRLTSIRPLAQAARSNLIDMVMAPRSISGHMFKH